LSPHNERGEPTPNQGGKKTRFPGNNKSSLSEKRWGKKIVYDARIHIMGTKQPKIGGGRNVLWGQEIILGKQTNKRGEGEGGGVGGQ